MKNHLIRFCLCGLWPWLVMNATAEPAKSAGHWYGVLTVRPGAELRLAMDVTEPSPGKLEGVVISLDQGGVKLPLTTFTEKADAVVFTLPRGQINFEGALQGAGNEIAGTWKQGPVNAPIIFKRTATTATLTRPQEPKGPLPYRAEEVVVENKAAGIKLAGTLTLPTGAGPHPAVVLITGSGPQDRDEAVAGHRPFLVLADYLTRHGIAVLRCDDRGMGKSGGDFAKAIEPDFVEDARAMVAFLKGRSETDAKRIGLLGHSEGGLIAPRLAANNADVAFVVMLAGPGLPLGEVLIRQKADFLRQGKMDESLIATNTALEREIFQAMRSEKDPAAAVATVRGLIQAKVATLTQEQKLALGVSPAAVEMTAKLMGSPWFRDLMDYDPKPVLQTLTCPVLALNGAQDMQVSSQENLPAIREALKTNPRARVVELPGLNHLFQACSSGSPMEYSKIEETMNPAALTLIADWIRETTAR